MVRFIVAFQSLQNGAIIKSLLSDREIKKENDDYYWRRNVEGSKLKEWRMCKLDEGLFTSGEVQKSWMIIH